MFLEECKYIAKETKIRKYTNDLEISSDDSDEENSNKESIDI